MAKFDIASDLNVTNALNTAAITSNTTTNGATVDLKGYQAVMFVIKSGTLTDGAYAINVQESDDGSTYTDAAAADLVGTEPSFAATEDNTAKKIGYIGEKRYARIQVVSTSVTSGGTIGAVAVRGHADVAPVA